MAAQCRLFFIHLIHLVVFGLLAWRMFEEISVHTELSKENNDIAYIVGGILTALSGIVQLGFSFKFVCTEGGVFTDQLNMSNLLFILGSLAPFGIGIHYGHLNAAILSKHDTIGGRTECVTLANSKDYRSYNVFLVSIASLIITSALYPNSKYEDSSAFYNDKVTKYSSIMNAFALLDIIDMAELMFSDIGCYQTFGKGLISFFYIVLAISMILTTVYAGLEQPKNGKHDNMDLTVTILNLVFNDLLFLVLRIVTMVKTGHMYFGLIFVTKEALSLIFRIAMIGSYCCCS